jgi:RNA polymerase sigma-70 factor, ECF subfamily
MKTAPAVTGARTGLNVADKKRRFETLARPELDALFRTARRIVGNHALAAEVAQETCLKAYVNFDPADEPTAFRPWLFRIAINCALDAVRRDRRERAAHVHDAVAVQMAPDRASTGQPQAIAESREIGRAVDRALMALRPEIRNVAILVLVEEMSYADAAVALSITDDLVRSRLSRARAELRRLLADHAADLALRVSSPVAMTAKGGLQ